MNSFQEYCPNLDNLPYGCQNNKRQLCPNVVILWHESGDPGEIGYQRIPATSYCKLTGKPLKEGVNFNLRRVDF